MQVLDGLRRGKLERAVANSLFFGLQTASSNLKRAEACLQPFPWKVITEDPVDEARAARLAKDKAPPPLGESRAR